MTTTHSPETEHFVKGIGEPVSTSGVSSPLSPIQDNGLLSSNASKEALSLIIPSFSQLGQWVVEGFRDTAQETRSVVTSSRAALATAALFFFSGMAALIYQVVWQRALTQEIGVDSVSIAFIVTIFMTGLGFGSLAGGKLTAKMSPRTMALMYVVLELIIGVYGFFCIDGVRQINAYGASLGAKSILFDFGLNCSVLLFPTFLMGMTTPIIVDYIKSSLDQLGHTIGCYYGVNVLGAASGSILSLFLIELLGLKGTTMVAVAINVTIAALFFMVSRASKSEPIQQVISPAKESSASGVKPSPLPARMLTASFLFGFVTLSLQMILFRMLSNFFTPTSFVFPVLLCSYLVLMATGQLMAGRFVDWLPPAKRPQLLVYLLIGGCLSTLAITYLPLAWLDNLYLLIKWPKNICFLPQALLISTVVMLPVAFFSGYLPTVSRLVTEDITFAGRRFGTVLFWSTMGNILGTFLTALVLFKLIGSMWSLALCLGLALVGVLLLMPQFQASLSSAAWKGLVALVTFSMLMIPKDYYFQSRGAARGYMTYMGTNRPMDIIEGHTSVTTIYRNGIHKWRYEVRPNNSGASAAINNEHSVFYRYYSLAALQMADPSFRPKRVLLIGLGSGEFPYVMKELDFVEEFVIVELSPEVMKAYKEYSDPVIAQTTAGHPKVKVIKTDGRRYVQKALARGEKFDLIQVGIVGLSVSGASNIYSQDFFSKLVQLLNPHAYLALEPYIGVARLGYNFFDYGFQFPGSSWIFMHDQPLPIKDQQTLVVDEYQMRQYMATSLADLHTPLKEPCVKAPLEFYTYNKSDVLQHFNTMMGTDDRLIFEYFYLSELSPGFVWPVQDIQSVTGLPKTLLKVNGQLPACASLTKSPSGQAPLTVQSPT